MNSKVIRSSLIDKQTTSLRPFQGSQVFENIGLNFILEDSKCKKLLKIDWCENENC